jgi:fermentation-respiration switch protein FrsA (DUF1100 family)
MSTVEERESVVLENNGQKIFAVLHLPRHIREKAPAVLVCHGFGGNKVGVNRIYVNQAEQLAASGIIALRFDFRGCGDSEGGAEEITLEGEVADAQKALHYLSEHPYVSPSRIGILGASLGGTVSVMTAARSPSIKSMALWAPVASGRLWISDWQKKSPEQFANHTSGDPVIYNGRKINPVFFAEFMKLHLDESLKELAHIPLLHLHGAQDATVELAHADCFEEWRQSAFAQNRFIRLPEGDHNFANPNEQEQAITETLRWFQQTL